MRDFVRPARPADRDAVEALLAGAGLPLDGVAEAFHGFLVAEQDERVVGAIGVEAYGDAGLLRSAVVDPGLRGSGLGGTLVAHLLADARVRGLRALFLLTTTADAYFPRFGFRRVERAEVPQALQRSPELRGACPASAVVMRLDLEER